MQYEKIITQWEKCDNKKRNKKIKKGLTFDESGGIIAKYSARVQKIKKIFYRKV